MNLRMKSLLLSWMFFGIGSLMAQTAGPSAGIEIITSGGKKADSVFIALLGGPFGPWCG